jgi:hypothetical protein
MKKTNTAQLTLDLFAEKTAAYSKKSPAQTKQDTISDGSDSLTRRSMQQAVIGWLLPQNPNGIGLRVPTRLSRFMADIAAFWSTPQRQLLQPAKTVIVELRDNREQCWADCADREKLLKELRKQKENKELLETEIRTTEPQLKELDNLFDEYQSWNYAASSNINYHKCLKKIEKLQHSLYKGSKFEQIRSGHVATHLYLAVPQGEVHAGELADGWGLLYIDAEMNISVIKSPVEQESPLSNRLHLVQNIAAAGIKSVAFENGVVESREKIFFVKRPHRRRIQR